MGSNAQPLWAPGLSAHFWDTFWKLRDPGRVERPVTTAGTQQQTLVSPPSLSHPPHTSLLLPGIPTPVTACSRAACREHKQSQPHSKLSQTRTSKPPRPPSIPCGPMRHGSTAHSATFHSRELPEVSTVSFPTDPGTTWQTLYKQPWK